MIAIINYGLGNVRAFANVYKKMNIPFVIVKRINDLKNISKVILPGVGSFDKAMQMFEKSGMRQVLEEMVLYHHIPVLGVCVGMQMLARSSEEGNLPGFGWIDGEVKKFSFTSSKDLLPVPHMGWNNFKPLRANGLLRGLNSSAHFYFLHSYFFQCHKNNDVIAVTDYGGEFTCVVNSGNIFGVQFHPEKSHQWGVQLLENFSKI